ncbi:MAG: hypothetical protein K5851_08960 [Lachnospiraceae bacterium]|nr:hypothetical protein [Lachnospiraceae bacterium]
MVKFLNKRGRTNSIFPKKTIVKKEAPFCILAKEAGSYTIEAAASFSIFIFVMITFLFLMRAITTEYLIRYYMFEVANKSSCIKDIDLSEKVDEKEALKVALKLSCIKKIKDDKLAVRFIKGGALGLDFSDSEVDEQYIVLDCKYSVVQIFSFIDKSIFKFHDKITVRRYVGWNPSMDEEEEFVYVTKNGEAYHHSRDCRYLKLSIKEVDISNIKNMRSKDGHKYRKCTCVKKKKGSKVYVTDYGEQYHGDLNCVDLRRNIRVITLEEAKKNYHECPKCKGD